MDFQLLSNVFITNQVGRVTTSHWLHTVHYSEAEPEFVQCGVGYSLYPLEM